MGERNCAVDGCNALEFRTTGICNRHLSMGVDPLEDSTSILMAKESDGVGEKIPKDRNFWMGLIIPTILPVTFFILLFMAELLSWDWGTGISLLLGWACSFCLWPVIGFELASNNKIVENMRNGAKLSGKIGLIIGGLMFLIILSFLSGGVTN